MRGRFPAFAHRRRQNRKTADIKSAVFFMLTVYCKKIIIKLSNDKGMNIMNIAILYQVKEPPQVGNIRKPMKEGGYSDSGSDLAYELNKNGYNLITPVENPNEKNNIDWIFGDDDEGITKAINMGADVLWLKMHLEYIRQQKRRIIKSVKNLIKTVCL